VSRFAHTSIQEKNHVAAAELEMGRDDEVPSAKRAASMDPTEAFVGFEQPLAASIEEDEQSPKVIQRFQPMED
jgi:hypothetical protein